MPDGYEEQRAGSPHAADSSKPTHLSEAAAANAQWAQVQDEYTRWQRAHPLIFPASSDAPECA